MLRCDVVIVGGGIGGGALATALAGDGLEVVVLESSDVYEDRVRGESMLPWGVKEARELGVEQVLLDAGAHQMPAWIHYDADLPLEVSATDSFPSATDAPERSLRIVAHQRVSLLGIRRGEEVPCDTLESCLAVSRFLLDRASGWLD